MSKKISEMCQEIGTHVIGHIDHATRTTIAENPAMNSGAQYDNDTFAIRAYCWCDGTVHHSDEDSFPSCPPNFEYRVDGTVVFAARWYKHSFRELVIEPEIGDEQIRRITRECIASIGV